MRWSYYAADVDLTLAKEAALLVEKRGHSRGQNWQMVPLKTQAPLTRVGLLSTALQDFQSFFMSEF